MHRVTFVPTAALACALTLASTTAHAEAPTKEQCAATNEAAQRLRLARKLREAKKQLLVCAASACPQIIRTDCAQLLTEVEQAIPTVVLKVRGAEGVDLLDVNVAMDGSTLDQHYSGAAFEADPGPHTFRVIAPGYEPLEKQIVLRDADKLRAETLTLVPVGGVAKPRAGPTAPDVAPSGTSTTRVVSYAVGGLGILGLGVGSVLGLVAKGENDEAFKECKDAPTACTNDAAITKSEASYDKAAVATGVFIGGAVLLAGGVTLFFLSGKSDRVRVQATGSGLLLGGRF